MTLEAPPQEMRFCRSADGTSIAFAIHGSGPPLLLTTCWLSHLEFDWERPVWRHFLLDLGKLATVVRYDERGFGMSDWDVTDFSLEARVADLEAVVDAAGLDRCAMVRMSQGGPVAITYTVRHPDRVTRDPASDANMLLRIEGKFPMSEGEAYERLANLNGGGMDYIVYADDPGDSDNPIGFPHGFVEAPGPPGGLVIATPAGLAFSREFTVTRGDLNEDFCFSSGCGDDVDEVYVKVRFDQGGVGDLRGYTNMVSGRFRD